MSKKNLTSLFVLALLVTAVPALAEDGADIAKDNLLYFVEAADQAGAPGTFDTIEAFSDLHDDSVLYFQNGQEYRADAEGGSFGSVDYTRAEAWAATCDNYL